MAKQPRKDLELLQSIRTLAEQNANIINRIKNKENITVAYGYELCAKPSIYEDEFLKIKETQVHTQVEMVLGTWIPEVKFVEIPDFFNDKLNLVCQTFEDVAKLNEEFKRVAVKWGVFEGTASAIEALEAFLNNLTQLHVNLSKLDEKLRDNQSYTDSFNKQIREINERLKRLTTELNEKNLEGYLNTEKVRNEKGQTSSEKFGVYTSLIDETQYKTICSWLGDYSNRKWNLLYKASFDGFQANSFHRTCDNKGPTVTVVKSTTGHLFGGFTPIPWSSCKKSIQDSLSFIFTLTNPSNAPPTKYSHRAWSPQESIFDHPDYGPTFGQDPNVDIEYTDIVIVDNSNKSNQNSIHFPGSYMDNKWWGSGTYTFTPTPTFTVEDIEVFSLMQEHVEQEHVEKLQEENEIN